MLELAWSLFNTEQDLEQATFSSKECLRSVPFPPPLLACRERQVMFLMMTALGRPLQSLLRE